MDPPPVGRDQLLRKPLRTGDLKEPIDTGGFEEGAQLTETGRGAGDPSPEATGPS